MSTPDAAFYFDLASPLAYLAAERVLHAMPVACEWQPVLARTLKGTPSGAHPEGHAQRAHTQRARGGRQAGEPAGAESFEAFRGRGEEESDDEEISRLEVQRRAVELGLQELRFPDPFPFDSALAMRAATYAKSIGRVVAFAQAAFRQAFAGGHSLGETDRVLIAAAACEMHPSAVLKAVELGSTAEQLSAATAAAAELGVTDVPAVRVGERIFHGERALEEAAAYACVRAVGPSEHTPRTKDTARGAQDITATAAVRRAP